MAKRKTFPYYIIHDIANDEIHTGTLEQLDFKSEEELIKFAEDRHKEIGEHTDITRVTEKNRELICATSDQIEEVT